MGFIHTVFSMTRFLHSYLSKRRHRTKVNMCFSSWEELIQRRHRTNVHTSFSSWEELIKGVPQGSVFGPILFNIWFIFNEWSYLLINDSYLISDSFCLANFSEMCDFADGTALHACHNDLNNLIKKLEHEVFLAL